LHPDRQQQDPQIAIVPPAIEKQRRSHQDRHPGAAAPEAGNHKIRDANGWEKAEDELIRIEQHDRRLWMARGSHGFRQVPETRRFTGTGPLQRCKMLLEKPPHPSRGTLAGWHRTQRARLARVEGVPPARNEARRKRSVLHPSGPLRSVPFLIYFSTCYRLPGTTPSVHADSARRQGSVGGSSRTARAGSCVPPVDVFSWGAQLKTSPTTRQDRSPPCRR
jgi:hypothetical protein